MIELLHASLVISWLVDIFFLSVVSCFKQCYMLAYCALKGKVCLNAQDSS